MSKPKNNQPPKRRVRNAIGWLVRTVIIAAFVAAAVFGARYGYQWYLDRDAVDVELPVQAISPPGAQVINVRVTAPGVEVTATKDLVSGDAVLSANGAQFARSAGVFYNQLADGTWPPVSEADLVTLSPIFDQLDNASIVTFTDVFPVEIHPYITVVSATDSQVRGTTLAGSPVFEVAAAASDAPGADVLAQSGNTDPLLGEVLDMANDVAGNGSAQPSIVLVQVLEVEVDRSALTTADSVLAEQLGFTGDTNATVTVTVDQIGIVRAMTTEPGVGTIGTTYTLNDVLSTTTNPLEGIELGAPAAAPLEESEEL